VNKPRFVGLVANPQHWHGIIALSQVLPTVRIVNVARGHHDTEQACHVGGMSVRGEAL
jgi:hypothetical protein